MTAKSVTEQQIKIATQSIVFGYCREISKQYKMNIPQEIQYLMLGYYLVKDKLTIHRNEVERNDAVIIQPVMFRNFIFDK